jgi:hypothetical protein
MNERNEMRMEGTLLYSIYFSSVLVLSSQLHLGLLNAVFLSRNILSKIHTFLMHATCPAHIYLILWP